MSVLPCPSRDLVHRLAALGWMILVFGSAWPARADDQPAVLERQIKAAYLYKFTGYVQWPGATFAREDAPLTIGVFGNGPLADDLDALVVGHSVENRRISVLRLEDPPALDRVHILFVGRDGAARFPELARLAQALPVLVVTDWEGSLAQGSMINFVLSQGRVRFEVAPAAAEKSGLTISSRLLSVAINVESGRR